MTVIWLAGRLSLTSRCCRGVLVAWVVAACSGGKEAIGPVAPPPPGPAPVATVAAVVITSPVLAPVFHTLQRTLQFTAEARDSLGHVLTGRTLAWNTTDGSVVLIGADGVALVKGNGSAGIWAAAGSVVSAVVPVTVSQRVATVSVLPAAVTFGALQSTRSITVTALDSGGAPAFFAPQWTVSDSSVASVIATNTLRSAGNGTATATVTVDGASANVSVIVQQVPRTLILNPTTFKLVGYGQTLQLGAIVWDSNAVVIPGSPVGWKGSDVAILTVSTSGLVTSVGNGRTTIDALAGPLLGTVQANVSIPIDSFHITPHSVTLTQLHQQVTFSQFAWDSAGVPISNIGAAFTCSDLTLVICNAAGIVQAEHSGTVSVSAVTVWGQRDSALVTIAIPGFAPPGRSPPGTARRRLLSLP